jgi:hypothetical protein
MRLGTAKSRVDRIGATSADFRHGRNRFKIGRLQISVGDEDT